MHPTTTDTTTTLTGQEQDADRYAAANREHLRRGKLELPALLAVTARKRKSSLKVILRGLSLATCLSFSPAYAADCTTSFDQHCLASRYNQRQVDRHQSTRVAGLNATRYAQEAQALKAQAAERARVADIRDERRHHQNLRAIEESHDVRRAEHKERLEAIDRNHAARMRRLFGRY